MSVLFSLLGSLSWMFLAWLSRNDICSIRRGIRGCGGDEEQPDMPANVTPDQALGQSPYLQYLQQLIGQGVGKTVAEPSEYGLSSQALQNLLGTNVGQYQYPTQDILNALKAQQTIDIGDWKNQINPQLA
jgi:hypothetical protein